MNDKWEWVVEPRYEEITVQSDWTLAVAQGREEVVLLDAKGEAIGAGKGYRSLAPMGAFWLAELRAAATNCWTRAASAWATSTNANRAASNR